jgi:carotenoid cleavage dioxygenase-like enzyme
MYVRNGGNPVTNSDLGRDCHWFDGDGMLSGVWFDRSPTDTERPIPNFVNQFIVTDVYQSSLENSTLRTPILPSISTLVNPLSSLFYMVWRILRAVLIVLISHCPGSQHAIKRISVANTSVIYHDGRALATCESGPPMRFTLPGLETVGWYNGNTAEGEPDLADEEDVSKPVGTKEGGRAKATTFGGTGPLSWMREWTTGHPKVDHTTGELVLFHCCFAPPYVQYSLVPAKDSVPSDRRSEAIMNAPVPGCTGGKLMHDFGVSKNHTVILDLPLSLTPMNLVKNNPVVLYEPKKPARFGVFPRRDPASVRWFEAAGCCIFHTANTWDEYDSHADIAAVNLLACRLTSASLIFSSANIAPPPHPNRLVPTKRSPMSFFAKYDNDQELMDPEKVHVDESSPLLTQGESSSCTRVSGVPISCDEQEQCRLYYYRFAMGPSDSHIITHQFALAAIPFEFPTVSPLTEMAYARYIYGCSTINECFGAALGKATKVELIVRMDVTTLLVRSRIKRPEEITGCVDNRSVEEILSSKDSSDPIRAFRLPPKHFAQEPRFVPRKRTNHDLSDTDRHENDGFLVFYVFNESQLDEHGECTPDAKSELWVLDAATMDEVICKIQLPTRVPYGLHGNWFSEEMITGQRSVETLRATPTPMPADTRWKKSKASLLSLLG